MPRGASPRSAPPGFFTEPEPRGKPCFRQTPQPLRRGRGRRPPRDDPRRRSPRADRRPRATRCTAARSSRPTGATCTSPRATAGSRNTTSGAWRRSSRFAPASTRATLRSPRTASTDRVANYLPHSVTLFDSGQLRQGAENQFPRVRRVRRRAAQELRRRAEDVPELWEISYDPKAEDIRSGWCTTSG